LSYSALVPQWEQAGERFFRFLSLLRYATDSPLLNYGLVVGLPLLLAVDALQLTHISSRLPPRFPPSGDQHMGELRVRALNADRRAVGADFHLVGFGALFLSIHAVLSFQVWDRYLLGLVPLMALLLARVLTLPWRAGGMLTAKAIGTPDASAAPDGLRTGRWPRCLYVMGLIVLVVAATASPLQDAAASRLPIGGDHGAYDGIEQVVDFFKAVPADTTFYHRWLGAHWRFYLWNSPYDFRSWTSPADLAAQAVERPGARRYVVFPSWQSATEARLALESVGLGWREELRTLRRDGSISFIVYRIAEAH
jgi:hypothetical protein